MPKEPDLYSNISNPEHPSYMTGMTEEEDDLFEDLQQRRLVESRKSVKKGKVNNQCQDEYPDQYSDSVF